MITSRSAALSSLAWLVVSGTVACSSSSSPAGDDIPLESLASALSSAGATTIVAKNSGACVDVPAYSRTSGAALDQWKCNGGANQSFVFTPATDGVYTVRSQSSGLCLQHGTTRGAPVVQVACSGGTDQEWVARTSDGGAAQLATTSGGECLNVSGASSANGAAIITWTCDAESDELFTFTLPSASPPPVDAGSPPPPVDAGSPPPQDAGPPAVDAGPSPPIVPAFYVATDGSDTNPGTVNAPFATFAKAQAAMRASSAIKTTYIRQGSYRLSQTLGLGSADSGETWSYYPPDGVDSASLSGGSTNSSNGLSTVISVSNTNHLTIDGLTIRDFQYAGIDSGGGTSNLLVENNVIFDGYTQTNNSNPAGISCYGCADTTITHNVIHDIAQSGVSFNNVNGDISNLLVTGNVFYDTCTANADCGAVYVQDIKAIATNIRLTDNYIHDGNTFAGLNSGYGAALYADDCTSNVTMSGNVITGRNGANTTMTHGGSNVRQTGNLTDLAGYAQHVATFQTSGVSACSSAVMSGNEYVGNVVIGAGGGGGFALLSGSPQHAPTIANNDYWSYAGAPISSGSGSYADTKALRDDPDLSGWEYAIAAGSPVLAAPVAFPPLVGGWGPPGYVLPEAGTAPSSPH